MEVIEKSAYFVSASVRVHSHGLYSIECVSDTWGQPSLVANAFFPEHWTVNRQAAEHMHFRFAFKDSTDVIGRINLYTSIADSSTTAAFHILDKKALSIPSRTSFKD